MSPYIAGLVLISLAASQAPSLDVLTLASRYVERYYGKAQTIVSRETVRLQPLDDRLRPAPGARELVYELRVTWEAPVDRARPEATVERRLLQVDGRLRGAAAKPEWFDPLAASPDPLTMLLASRQKEFVFKQSGTTRIEGRTAARFDFHAADNEPPTVTWRGNFGRVDLGGRARGRVWIDPRSGEVLRLDEWLAGPVQYAVPVERIRPGASSSEISQTIVRYETSTRYAPVRFRGPDETVLLPAATQTMTVIERGGIPRLLTTQTFTDYRRFLTTGRMVK